MTAKHVEDTVAGLRDLALTNPTAAHAGADELRRVVLRAIADGVAEDPQAVAAAAVTTVDEDIGGC